MQDPNSRQRLVDELSLETATKERWREIHEMVPQNEFEIAKKYYYLNRTSFSGKLVHQHGAIGPRGFHHQKGGRKEFYHAEHS